MFHLRGDDVAALVSQKTRHAEQGKVGAFAAAAGENDLARLAFQGGRNTIAGIVQQRARALADMMHAGRIAPILIKRRHHHFLHLGIKRCGGVVIQIYRAHAKCLLHTPRRCQTGFKLSCWE